MSQSKSRDDLPVYELTAVNFAEDSTNKIHSDDVARDYGFAGGLVPGIAVYGYMTHPMVRRFGDRWLNSGYMNSKFVKPVYNGDKIRIESQRTEKGENAFEIKVFNAGNSLCAVGLAGIAAEGDTPPQPSDYPRHPLPEADQRIEARIESLRAGLLLGDFDFFLERGESERKAQKEYLDALDAYSGSAPVYHPAYLLRQGNFIVSQNVDLGPWIHTSSEVRNFESGKVGERLNIRGRVARSFEKKGHELADFDLAVFNTRDRCVMKILHTAIVRLKPPA
jgi:acyl dehydratase